ncbi:MAG: hypothetical protein QXZ09_06975 [Candidatus Methanomethylicaceae archaeon]
MTTRATYYITDSAVYCLETQSPDAPVPFGDRSVISPHVPYKRYIRASQEEVEKLPNLIDMGGWLGAARIFSDFIANLTVDEHKVASMMITGQFKYLRRLTTD